MRRMCAGRFQRPPESDSKPRARLVEVGDLVLLSGVIAKSTGSCPICGSPVPLRHAVGRGRVADHYACATCGPVVYASLGLAG